MAVGNYRKATVLTSEFLTPNLKRVVLTGPDLSNFPCGYESGYVKLLFTKQGRVLREDEAFEQLTKKNIMMRTYTVRAFDKAKAALTIDFALHSAEKGVAPASDWAKSASVGDEIIVGGPGATKLADPDAAAYLFVGDMTALPAISCNLEYLPTTARGNVIIEVCSEADIHSLKKPDNIDVIWLVNPTPGKNSQLLEAIKNCNGLSEKPFVWCACEFETMRIIRRYLKRERHFEKQDMYISSYWKYGCTEEQHKIEKRTDAELEG
ncbi:siderophore-interacting protein [Pseudoalteromonas luteoviolacea]|uniref:siderophore-interacting protein n=1 Tax=Pseudoalteromonas luteoviolacea TaxID=43657 RepID=UPI001B372F05|nr:siderophore-interacting protein [Pseudoalteromonas luteoviolacea]MBQ4811524.1 siderophore-interacting protein [Pseudoalteromonas luteoviolacea]